MTTPSSPQFLADESCDFRVIRALRNAGYDVVAVSEFTHHTVDRALIEQSARERRILLTEDKDFGWLVFVGREDSAGVILIRFPGDARDALEAAIVRLVREHSDALVGGFVVVQPGMFRFRRPPSRR